ncbi:MAG TPA: Hsp20/alpha crystallin family protein [Methylophilaceae bacterium]|nr:Hsp20/alpha crystallin family protein [Methylophilaceae bacterium]
MKLESLKENVSSIWDTVAEGWRYLTESASSALTKFRPSSRSNLPEENEIDDRNFQAGQSWAMLGGDVFEDDKRIVVRLEIPGMRKDNIDIEVSNNTLVISGEKSFEKEETEGRWRVMQCAYGAFRRSIPLPTETIENEAQATYKDGVLRIELPKQTPSKPKTKRIEIH